MTPKKARWVRIKAKGRRRFILESAIAFGLGCGLAVASREEFWGAETELNWWHLLIEFTFGVIIPAIFAAYGASLYWGHNERKESG